MMVHNNEQKLFCSKNCEIKYEIKIVYKKHLKVIIEKV